MTDQAVVERRAALRDENLDPATFANPTLDCDIVMKGGITSGVVYPGAVLRLARRYRFRSIGGTSAGAIAAAVVAAAEHARKTALDAGPERSSESFTKVAQLPDQLSSTTASCQPFMLQLFQPDTETRPLFETVIGFMRDWKPIAVAGALKRFWKGPLTAVVVAAGSILMSTEWDADPAFAVAGVALAVLVGLVGLVADVLRAVQCISDNHFGMCRLGPPEKGKQRPDALTPWLHKKIQDVAGLPENGPPLTFADLWGVPRTGTPSARSADMLERSRNPEKRRVDLQVVTTDLTHGRPIRLPVPYQPFVDELEDEAAELFFDPEEMGGFFPDDVVRHLERFSPAPPTPGSTYRRFPIGPDLPIVVATRMSLSFPFLISAIPLYHVEPDGTAQPHRVVFSDGGVTSNFPIHFFDSPLPRRPTFGLNLTGFGRDEQPDLDNREQAVRAPGWPGDPAVATVLPIDGLGPFFNALKNAAQNWRDNAQAALPGYRDRIVHIKLAESEGGLNLVMPADTILRMNDRGDLAGEKLVGLFAREAGEEPAPHWRAHRFVRFRVSMVLIQQALERFARSYHPDADSPSAAYADEVEKGGFDPYTYSPELVAAARKASAAYVEIVRDKERLSLDDAGTPRPPSTLRAVPPV